MLRMKFILIELSTVYKNTEGRMNIKAELNYQKQMKNAKRGGHKPNIAKDVNKHKVQKVQKLIKELETEYIEHWEFWRENSEMYDQGYANAISHVQNKLVEILQVK